MIDENGAFTEKFTTKLPEMLGDNFYNDPDTKQQPTKMFDNIKDMKTLVNAVANGQRTISKGEAAFAEKTKGMVKIPSEKATPEEIATYRKAMNVPETVDGYELSVPDGDDAAGYKAVADVVRTAALQAGVPKNALSTVWDTVITALDKQAKDLEAKGLEMMKTDEEAQKAIHKENYPAFVKAGDDTLAKLKAGPELTKILETFGIKNHPAIRNILHEISPLILAGKTFGGDAPAGGQTGEGWPMTYKYDPNTGKPIE